MEMYEKAGYDAVSCFFYLMLREESLNKGGKASFVQSSKSERTDGSIGGLTKWQICFCELPYFNSMAHFQSNISDGGVTNTGYSRLFKTVVL